MCCNYCNYYMSYLFSYKNLIEYENKEVDKDNVIINIQEPLQASQPQESQQPQHMTDAQSLTVSTLTTNSDEFKFLFLTQEKMCYELRSENTILKNQLKMNISTNKKQLQEIKRLKLKMCKLESANTTFEKVLGYSNYSNNNNGNNGNNFAPPPPPFPPPPPPPLPLNTFIKQKVLPPMPMNTVLEEFKSKFKPKD